MTIQATITTLILSVSMIPGSWALAGADATPGDPGGIASVQFEVTTPLFAEPSLPIGMVASRIAADPGWGHRSILEETSTPEKESTPEETSPKKVSAPEEAASPRAWQDSTGTPLPFHNDSEILEFLRTARVVTQKTVGVGVNEISKVLLEKDGVQLHGAFRKVSIFKHRINLSDGSFKNNFRDDCRFEVAAYRLSKLLGLDNVPPVVKRKIGRDTGTLQVWVENTMMEKQRHSENLQAPRELPWTRQWQTVRLFDNLIDNDDRNEGNILIDSDWKVWMIDHTRSFTGTKKLRNPLLIRWCRRDLWEKLQELDREVLKQECKGVLSGGQIKALMARRDLLVQHIQKKIDEKGEGTVLFANLADR